MRRLVRWSVPIGFVAQSSPACAHDTRSSSALARATTLSTVKPRCSSTVVARAPTRRSGRARPSRRASPTQRFQPSEMPASTESRASHVRRQHLVAVLRRLQLEELPARHRDDARARAVLGQPPRRVERERHLGAASRSGSRRARRSRPLTPRARTRRARRPDAGATSSRSSVGTFCRESASATGPSCRSSATFHAYDGLVRVGRAGRTRGSGSRAAPCSARPAGASARPRRARPSRASTTQTTGRCPSAESRTAGPHVVGEDQERRAVRLDHAAVERDPVHDRAHRVLADAERDVAAATRRREKRPPPSNSV